MGGPSGGTRRSPSACADFFAAFPDVHWEPWARLDDERAFSRYRFTATLQQDMGPFRPTGQRLQLDGAQVLETAARSIRQSQDLWDSGTFHRQMTTAG